ncbi:hypothetical protein HanRHA438_Chr01g0007231 [Helianthus annuus]|nr:hypothetical protein HanRHA438_Chr01g0007231 [Helianthus annuus]
MNPYDFNTLRKKMLTVFLKKSRAFSRKKGPSSKGFFFSASGSKNKEIKLTASHPMVFPSFLLT